MATTIKVRYGVHSNGTKAYVLIRNPAGAVHPYGFAIWGGFKKKPTITNYGRDKFNEQESAKTTGGYKFRDVTINVPDGDDIQKALCNELQFGYPIAEHHPDAMKMFLDMYRGITVVKTVYDDAPVPKVIEEALEQRKAALIDKVKNNSTWGCF